MLYKKEYDLAYKYLYYENRKGNLYKNAFSQIPDNLIDIFKCFVGANSAFNESKKFENNVTSIKYKYYVLFILLCIMKDRIDHIKSYEGKPIYALNFEQEIEDTIAFDSEFINALSNREIFFNYFNDISIVYKYMEEFFVDRELSEKFDFFNRDIYERFIKENLNKITTSIENKKNHLLKASVDISDVKKQYLEAYNYGTSREQLDTFLFARNLNKKSLMDKVKWSFTKYNFRKPRNKAKIFIEAIEKAEYLMFDGASSVINRFNDSDNLNLFYMFAKRCIKINNINEIEKNINLSDYIVISNFNTWKDAYSKLVGSENVVCLKEIDSYARDIIIGKYKIPIIKNNDCFNENDSKYYKMLLINRKLFRITAEDYEDPTISEEPLGDLGIFKSIDKKYLTDKKIVIKARPFLNAEFAEEKIGYYLTKKR